MAHTLPLTRIKMRQLQLLAQLDRERSVLRAAQAVGMSQPAASKLLRELEQTLGVPLFERHARGVEPNGYGEIVMRHAHSVLSEVGRVHDEVEALKRGGRYRVAIGSVVSPAADMLPAALALLAARHPQLNIGVEMDTSAAMVARLLEGRLDIVIGRIPEPELAAALRFEPLADEPHSLIARAGHPLARRRRLRVEDLVDSAWVLPPPGSVLRERLEAMFLQRGLALPQRVVETLSVPLIIHLLRQSDLLVALPEPIVRPYCEGGMLTVLPVELNVRMDAFGLIVRRHHALSRHAEEALEALRHVAQAVYR